MRRTFRTLFVVAAGAAMLQFFHGAHAYAASNSRPLWVPADATARSGCVTALGYIFWNPKRLPFGPTFGAYDGKPVFEEIMIGQRQFTKGMNWNDVARPVPPFKVDHVDIWFAPHGHEGFPAPHYDILLVFMPHVRHMHLCHNPTGALPDFVLQEP